MQPKVVISSFALFWKASNMLWSPSYELRTQKALGRSPHPRSPEKSPTINSMFEPVIIKERIGDSFI
jgi:hypothetical protein